MIISGCFCKKSVKGIVRFEMNFWYVLAYLKGILEVSTVFSKKKTISVDKALDEDNSL